MSEQETVVAKCVCCNTEGRMPKELSGQASYCCEKCCFKIAEFFIGQVLPFCVALINDRSEKKGA